MRILFAVPSYWPSLDGVANITRYLAEGLVSRGHEVLIYTSAGNGGLQELAKKEKHNGVQIERTRVYVRWPLRLRGRDEESTEKAYRSRIRAYEPDVLVVVCSQTWTLDWIKSCLDEIKCPKVFYSHGYSKWAQRYTYGEQLRNRNVLGVLEQYLCKRYYDTLYKYIKKFDLAIYLSEENSGAVYAKQHGLTNGRILENAIEDVFFLPEMKHQYLQENKEEIIYLFVANYGENKNHEMLIEAYSKADIGKSRLVFAGFEENEYSDYLNHYTADVMKDAEKQVVFHFHLTREEVIELYRQSDVFVCSSKSETWSIVAHEAAAVAMPIISTDVGVYSEIDGAVIVKDVKQMQEALEQLYHQPQERAWRGEAAYEWLAGRGCRIEDKVEWLERNLIELTAK